MEEALKQQIRESLHDYCNRLGSQNKASKTFKGVSSATISQIVNGNWDLIRDEMWRSIAAQIGFATKEWKLVETRDFKMMISLLSDAQDNSLVFAVTGEAGSGKSAAIRSYQEANQNVYVLSCNEYWNRKLFLIELLRAMGKESTGNTVGEMMIDVVHTLKRTSYPIIIFDESDKLTDQVLYFFITLYNALEDHCGIVLASTDHLEKRMKRGLRLNRKGYKEIYSRVGRKFIQLRGLSNSDISAVCIANGIEEKALIKQVLDDCENDLRRVKRKIHAIKKSLNND